MTTTERFTNGISGKKKTIINDKSGAFSKENAPLFFGSKDANYAKSCRFCDDNVIYLK